MEIFNIYENIIREKEASVITNFCTKSFGKKLFGDQLGSGEPNTRKEQSFADEIRYFTTSDYGFNLKPELISALKELKLCVSEYPEVLKSEGKLYRGIYIKFKVIYNNLNTLNDNFIMYEYQGRGAIQSWSEDYDIIVKKFGWGKNSEYLDDSLYECIKLIMSDKFNSSDDEKKINMLNIKIPNYLINISIPVILETDANPDEFLFKGKYFNKLSAFDDESEVLRINSGPLTCKALLPPNLGKLCQYIIKFDEKLNFVRP